jgi:hypothetical protein
MEVKDEIVSSKVLIPVLLVVSAATIALAVKRVISIQDTYQVQPADFYFPWEPSSAYGTVAWAVSKAEVTASTLSGTLVSAFTVNWSTPVRITSPSGLPLQDFNLAFDSVRARFVFAALDVTAGNANVWYGYSNNNFGLTWSVVGSPLPSSMGNWDYPSIGVDASGRVIIGATLFAGGGITGYYTAVSTNGSTFATPSLVSTRVATTASRVVATSNAFNAFVFSAATGGSPTAVTLFASSDGITWPGSTVLATFLPAMGNSPNESYGAIYYSLDLQAQGYTNGLWTVAFPVNNAGYNNIFICTSDRGCGLANAAADDEFLQGTSASGDQGYWLNYYTFSTLYNRQLPLVMQAIYYPHGAPGIGATTTTGIDPRQWVDLPAGRRCLVYCYAAGDFNTIAHAPGGVALTPFESQTAFGQVALFQNFLKDPQAPPTPIAFVPNFIPYPVGADLRGLGKPLPPGTEALPVSPRNWGRPPQ